MKPYIKHSLIFASLVFLNSCALHEVFVALKGQHWGTDTNGKPCMVKMSTNSFGACPNPKLDFFSIENESLKLEDTHTTCGSISVPMTSYSVIEEDAEGNPRVIDIDGRLRISYDSESKTVTKVIFSDSGKTCDNLSHTQPNDLSDVSINNDSRDIFGSNRFQSNESDDTVPRNSTREQ